MKNDDLKKKMVQKMEEFGLGNVSKIAENGERITLVEALAILYTEMVEGELRGFYNEMLKYFPVNPFNTSQIVLGKAMMDKILEQYLSERNL